MTFRIKPRPPRDTAGYQQAVELKRTLETGGWTLALAVRGPTPEHILLTSAMWAIAWQAKDAATRIEYDGHVLDFRYFRNKGWACEVDGFPTSVKPDALQLMLID